MRNYLLRQIKDKGHRLILVIPFSLFLAILLGFGPYLQHFSFSALEQGAPSAADFESGPSLVLLPSLADWTVQFLYGPFFWIALPSAYLGSRAETPIRVSGTSGLAVFTALCLLDFFTELFGGNLTSDSVTRNFIANFVGSSLLPFISAFAISAYEYVYSQVKNTS